MVYLRLKIDRISHHYRNMRVGKISGKDMDALGLVEGECAQIGSDVFEYIKAELFSANTSMEGRIGLDSTFREKLRAKVGDMLKVQRMNPQPLEASQVKLRPTPGTNTRIIDENYLTKNLEPMYAIRGCLIGIYKSGINHSFTVMSYSPEAEVVMLGHGTKYMIEEPHRKTGRPIFRRSL